MDRPWAPFLEKYGRLEDLSDGSELELVPRRLVLEYTREYIELPPTLAARIEGKSGPARRGLMVHLTAPTVQAGWHGQLQLEMYNVGPATLLLTPGTAICQLILEQVTDPQRYGGQFQGQGTPELL